MRRTTAQDELIISSTRAKPSEIALPSVLNERAKDCSCRHGCVLRIRRATRQSTYSWWTGWGARPELNEQRFKLSKAVVSLRDGRVLIADGAERPEVYDPQSRAFIPVGGATLDGFCFSTATLLNDGRVLLAGGYSKPGGAGVNHAWLCTGDPMHIRPMADSRSVSVCRNPHWTQRDHTRTSIEHFRYQTSELPTILKHANRQMITPETA